MGQIEEYGDKRIPTGLTVSLAAYFAQVFNQWLEREGSEQKAEAMATEALKMRLDFLARERGAA